MLNLGKCHQCSSRQRPCSGSCSCLIDGRDIIGHAEASYCPHPAGPRFGTATPPKDWESVPIVKVGELPPAPPAAPATGPGTAVRIVLEKMGIHRDAEGVKCPNGTAIAACGCAAMEAQMNQWGIVGCVRHSPEIMSWFTGKAGECGLGLDFKSVRLLLAGAWQEWRKSKN